MESPGFPEHLDHQEQLEKLITNHPIPLAASNAQPENLVPLDQTDHPDHRGRMEIQEQQEKEAAKAKLGLQVLLDHQVPMEIQAWMGLLASLELLE